MSADGNRILKMDSGAIEIARTLGVDYARYGIPEPSDLPAAFYEGYAEGSYSHRQGSQPDRFVRKWLLLRANALRRGKAVSVDVTPQFLESIDVPACPVTLKSLTHGRNLESDWSIDRLDNDGAYAVTNLCVISTKANEAKGSLKFDEVVALSRGTRVARGLSPREWSRLSALMVGPCRYLTPEIAIKLPQVAPLPGSVARFPWQVFQDYLVRVAAGDSPLDRNFFPEFLKNLPNNQARGLAQQLVTRIGESARQLESPFDAWFDQGLFVKYGWFFDYVMEGTHGNPLMPLAKYYRHRSRTAHETRELRLETRGRLVASDS